MKRKINSTKNNLSELAIIFCGKTNEFKVHEDCKTRVFEDIVDIALQEGVPIRVVKHDPICRVCKEPLACNGTKSINLNKNVVVKYQKYIHKKCEKSSCISSLIKFKEKYCNYMRSICNKGLTRSLMGYTSFKSATHVPQSILICPLCVCPLIAQSFPSVSRYMGVVPSW